MTTRAENETLLQRERDLLLVVEIQLGDNCPANRLDKDIFQIRQGFTPEHMHCEFITKSGEQDDRIQVRHFTQSVEHKCFCLTFAEFGCVPHITKVSDGSMMIETFVPDRDRAWELLTKLKETTEGVEIRRLNSTGFDGVFKESREVDLSPLSKEQREALEAAVEAGYFEKPRGSSLENLANEFDISASAFGQRLRLAQQKIMQQLF